MQWLKRVSCLVLFLAMAGCTLTATPRIWHAGGRPHGQIERSGHGHGHGRGHGGDGHGPGRRHHSR